MTVDIIDRFKRGEISLVELMEHLGRNAGREGGMPDRRKQDRPVEETPRRRATDKPGGKSGGNGSTAMAESTVRVHA